MIIRLAILRGAITALALLVSGAAVKAETLETQHAIIEHSPEDATLALIVGDTIDQTYGEMFIFFSQIGTMLPEPAKVPVNMDSLLLDLQQMLSGDDPIASTERDGAFAINIDPAAVTELDRLRTTVVHELFHHLSYRSGVVAPGDSEVAANLWLLEGTAEIAEYYFNAPHERKEQRFITYLQASEHHNAVGMVNAAHHAALFVYYLWQESPGSFRDLMSQFNATHDGAGIIGSMALDQYWYEFTKAMFNRAPAEQIIVNGGPLTNEDGEPYSPSFGSEGRIYPVPSQGMVTTDITLPPLSWQHAMLNVPGDVEWFNVVFGDLSEDDNFIVHAFLKDKQSEEYRYEDWSGELRRRVCNLQVGPCEDQSLDNVSKIVLIIANQSIDTSMEGELLAGSLDERWRLVEMRVNDTLFVPALGKLTLEFGTGGGLLVRSKGWWLKFPTDHFPAGTWTSAYNYINRACRFRGYVKFRRAVDDEDITYEDLHSREKYVWPTSRVEKGGLTNTPSGWFCDFRREMAGLGGVPVTGLASQAVVARVFTDLNTTEYPPGSFAGKLSAIMKAMMSLQVPQSGSKDVTMYHIIAAGAPRRLRVELQGNVRAFFEPYPE
jgi:hypothetical protein